MTKGRTDFPDLMPPHAFVYCSKNSLDDPKGNTDSEYDSCIFRGVRSTLVTPGVKLLDREGYDVGAAKASAHNLGFRPGTTLKSL